MQRSVTLSRAEHEIRDAVSVRLQLALAGQLVPPGGTQILLGAGHAAEADVGHPLAGLGTAVVVEVGRALLLCVPHPAQHLEGLVRLIAHNQVPSRCPGPDSNSPARLGRPRIKRSLIGLRPVAGTARLSSRGWRAAAWSSR